MRTTKFLSPPLIFSLTVYLVCGEKQQTSTDELDSLFQEIGFSPSCVSKTLALCENSARDLLNGVSLYANIFNKINQAPKRPQNCADLLHAGDITSGVRTIYPFACCENRPVSVFCNQATDGGGWTVIQHREALPERENFFRNWVEYEIGFGKLEGEFWLGLRNIHALVSPTLMELRVDLEDFEGKKRWAKYEYFYIGGAEDKYTIDLGKYSGNAEDSLRATHNKKPFSTQDKDHSENCATKYKGGWWYAGCHSSNLNGFPYEGNHTSFADGINWKGFRGYHHSLKTTSLSVRPVS